MASRTRKKPHAVCLPYPAQGHISPMMKLAKLLHFNGFHITFVNTEHNHRRFLKSRGPAALNGLPSFRFETITDGLPPSDPGAPQCILTLFFSVLRNCLQPFKELLSKLREDAATSLPDAPPPISWIVSDCSMIFAIDVSKEMGIPLALLWTGSASAFIGLSQYRRLIDEGIIPLKDSSCMTNGYLNKVIDWIPGLEGIRLKDIPSFIRTTDRDDVMLNVLIDMLEKLCQSSAPMIFHTFDALEHDVLEAISTTFALPIYSIGPLQLLLNQINNHDTTSIGSNLWPEQPECLQWLDLKDPNSVIYVNFGSITIIKHHQLIEFAWGLAKSNQSFLWVIRPDLVTGESSVLPSEFVTDTRGRGFLASWCDQERVLSHPSIGGFLTHCGWNSTIESLTSGVPLICWPDFADQMTNCWFCCGKWGVGMEMNEDVTRDEVEGLVRELIDGEKGREIRKKAIEWKRLSEEAAMSPNGSSYLNLEKLINQVLLSQN